MSIRVVKIRTGEEIITDIDGITKIDEKEILEENVVFNKPMSIHMIPSEQGIGLQLLPWPIYAKVHIVNIKSEDVLFCVEPGTDVRNQYAEMIGLPVVPDDSIILGTSNIKLSE